MYSFDNQLVLYKSYVCKSCDQRVSRYYNEFDKVLFISVFNKVGSLDSVNITLLNNSVLSLKNKWLHPVNI